MIEEQAVLSGTVKTIAAYGAFVEMEDGVTGLVHISQLSESRVENVESAVSVGSCVRKPIICFLFLTYMYASIYVYMCVCMRVLL